MFEVWSFNRLFLKLIRFVRNQRLDRLVHWVSNINGICIQHSSRWWESTKDGHTSNQLSKEKGHKSRNFFPKTSTWQMKKGEKKKKKKKTWENLEGYKCKRGLGKPTHTLVPCWMPKPLPPRNQCTGWFAPACKRWAWWGTMGRWRVWS